MRILVLCDDYWHPARTPRAGLAPLAAQGFAFDWIEQAQDWSAEQMAGYPCVLLTKANNVSAADQTPWAGPEVAAAFVAYVERGGGLLVVHSGAAGYGELAALRGLMGGAFAHHPPQCPVTVVPCEGHPLTAGAAPFTLLDEHYQMVFDDAAVEVLLTTQSKHNAQPGGWTRKVGAGRVCLLSPGHNLEVWLHPSYQALIANALCWCGKGADDGS
jgi:uncharacterized protein